MSGPIFVAGLGRCGSSLVMQMLSAGGIHCLGGFPAFEPDEVGPERDVAELLKSSAAMKIIDPHHNEWPTRFDARIIWLNRDPKEQAKSQAKFVQQVGGLTVPSGAWRAIRPALIADKYKCVTWWNRCSADPLFIKFEELLSNPVDSARTIGRFAGIAPAMWPRMEECVMDRAAKCRGDRSIEMALLRAPEVAETYGVSVMMAARRLMEAV